MDRICKFLHCLYMGITEAPNDAKRNDRPKEPDNKHTKIISIEPQSLQDGVRRMYVFEGLYTYMFVWKIDALNWVQQGIYLVQFRTLFLANWSTDRSMSFLRYICVSYLGTMSTMSLLFDLFATTLNLNWVQLMYVYIISHSFDNKYKQTDKHSKIYVTLTAHKKAHAFFFVFFFLYCLLCLGLGQRSWQTI